MKDNRYVFGCSYVNVEHSSMKSEGKCRWTWNAFSFWLDHGLSQMFGICHPLLQKDLLLRFGGTESDNATPWDPERQ